MSLLIGFCYYAHRDRQHEHIVYLYIFGLYGFWMLLLLCLRPRLWLVFLLQWFREFGYIAKKLATVYSNGARLSSEYSVTFQLNNSKSIRALIHTYVHHQCIAFTLVCDWKYPDKKKAASQTSQEKIVIVSLSRNLGFQPIWVPLCVCMCVCAICWIASKFHTYMCCTVL